MFGLSGSFWWRMAALCVITVLMMGVYVGIYEESMNTFTYIFMYGAMLILLFFRLEPKGW